MKTEQPHNQNNNRPNLDAPRDFLREAGSNTATLAAMLLAAQRLNDKSRS